MDLDRLYQRVLHAVDTAAYLTPTAAVDPAQRQALDAIGAMIHAPASDPAQARRAITEAQAAGRIDRVHALSALHVLAASPRVRDYAEAARLAGEQEQAALELGGPRLQANLASVDRHRGVLAFIMGHYDVALDHFTRALERQRSVENLGNVLAALLRLGDLAEARDIAEHARNTMPGSVAAALHQRIQSDPDLAPLRALEA